MKIREQAGMLLSRTGLQKTLEQYGTVWVTGSYRMDLMVWNDLDIYLCPDGRFDMYEMAASLNRILRPVYFDGIVRPEENRLFYGAELVFMGERWNVDIWVKDEAQVRESLTFCEKIKRQTEKDPQSRRAIIEIKKALIASKLYGFDKKARHYHSQEIYSAVLDEGIRSAEEFLKKHPV